MGCAVHQERLVPESQVELGMVWLGCRGGASSEDGGVEQTLKESKRQAEIWGECLCRAAGAKALRQDCVCMATAE